MLARNSQFKCLSCSSGNFIVSTTQWRCSDCGRAYACSSGIPRLYSEDTIGEQDRKLRDRFYDGVFGHFYQFMMPFIVMPVRPFAISWPHWLVFSAFVISLIALIAIAVLGIIEVDIYATLGSCAVILLIGLLLFRERYLFYLLILSIPTKISLLSRKFKPAEDFNSVHGRIIACAKASGQRLRILDVSTGSCNSLYRHGWMELDADYTAVDLSNTMLQQGSKLMSGFGIPVDLVIGDAVNLPFQTGYFDVVLSYGAVNGLTDPVKAIAEMARVARPGGTVLFLDEQLYPAATTIEKAYFSKVLSSHNVIHKCPSDQMPGNLEDVTISQVYQFYYICTARKTPVGPITS